MTVLNILNSLDHEVWAVIRPVSRGEDGRGETMDEIIVWSADWHGGDLPDNLNLYLDWKVDDICIEMREDPELHVETPMLVMNAY